MTIFNPNKRINTSGPGFGVFWTFALLLSFLLAGNSLFSQECDDQYEDKLELTFTAPSGGTATHTVYFKGVTYDQESCQSTWTYCVENGGSPEISHYVIGEVETFLECLNSDDIVDAVTSAGGCEGELLCDPASNTGLCGIKFDCSISDCDCFSFTLNGIYEVGAISFGIKAGTQSETGTIAGPTCETATLTCDDGDPCTIDDVLDADCNCAGTFVDEDGDGVCAADDCDDNDPNLGATAEDMDCDGVKTEDDCDDNDPSIGSNANDMDCDGITSELDCDDQDPSNTTTVPDCDCAFNPLPDCDGDGTPDHEEEDCDEDGIPDDCEEDRNGNGIPDECEPDCDGDGIPDSAEMDCDGNGIPNDCEAKDCDNDGYPDSCEPDCDGDGIPNDCEPDCDGDGVPDDCEDDCDGNGIPDDCEVEDCDGDGIPDDQEEDSDHDGVPDDCDICEGYDDNVDSDGDGVPDGCDEGCVLECDDCKLEGDFGSRTTISFCCLSITIDNWVRKDDSGGEYVGFEIVEATVSGEPVALDDIRYIVKAGGECYRGSGAEWVNPNGTSGPEAKAISHITFCENTDLCGIEPLFCDPSCPDLTSEEDPSVELRMAPNPVKHTITMHYQLTNEQEVSISVADIKGNLIISQKQEGKPGENELRLNVRDLGPGMYHVILKTTNGVDYERFIKVTE